MDAQAMKQIQDFANQSMAGISGLAEFAIKSLEQNISKMTDGMDRHEAAKQSKEAKEAAEKLSSLLKEMNKTSL